MTPWRLTAVMGAALLGASTGAAADLADDAMAAEESFWAARKAGDVEAASALLAPGYTSVESDCNGLALTEGAASAINRLKKDLAEGRYGSYTLRRMGAQVIDNTVVLTVGWQTRYTPLLGSTFAIRYTAGVETVVWAKGATGGWKRFHCHSHWRRVHAHAAEASPKP